MNRLVKWLMAALGAVVVVFVIAALVLLQVIDPNDYKQEIRAKVHAQTGRDLTIGGEIRWSVFPWIGLDMSEISLGNRSGFGAQPMFTAGKVAVSVKLIPPFHREIEFGSVELGDLSVYLRRNADGRNNWDDLGDAQTGSTEESSKSGSGIKAFKLAEINVNNANITWDDVGHIMELKDFHVSASNIEPGQPFDLKGGFSVNLVEVTLSGQMAVHMLSDSSNGVTIKNLRLEIGNSKITGNFKIENFDHPRLAFDFQADSINLDDYLGSSEESEGSTDLTADVFRGFTGGGTLEIGQMVVAGLTATDVELTLSSDGQEIRIYPATAGVYGGKHTGDFRIDAHGDHPILVARQQLTDVQAQALLHDLIGSSRLEGTGNLNVDIHTDLSNARSTRESLSGDLALNLHDGAIVGIDVTESLRKASALLGRQSETSSATGGNSKTDFSNLSMTATISQGIVRNDDLILRSPLLRMSGKGRINLVTETIDYLVKPVLEKDVAGLSTPMLDKIQGVPVPIRLSGNLYDPSIKVDISAALTASQKAKIDAKKDELKDKVLGKLLGGKDDKEQDSTDQPGSENLDDSGDSDVSAKDLLKGLFGSKHKKDNNKDGDDGNQ